MAVPPRTKQWSLALLSALGCLAVLQACHTLPTPSSKARYAVAFHYAQPVPVTPEEAARLKAILAKHHVRGNLTLNREPVLLPALRLQKHGAVAAPSPSPSPSPSPADTPVLDVGNWKAQLAGLLEADNPADLDAAVHEFLRPRKRSDR